METGNFEKLAFVSSTRQSAQEAMAELISIYGNVDASEADAIIPLGGDGFMLETLRKNLSLVPREIGGGWRYAIHACWLYRL